jgi:hypothetical protein
MFHRRGNRLSLRLSTGAFGNDDVQNLSRSLILIHRIATPAHAAEPDQLIDIAIDLARQVCGVAVPRCIQVD